VSSPGAPVSVPPAFREPSSSLCQEKHQRGKQVSGLAEVTVHILTRRLYLL
jgi:hypothetical protein